MTIAVRTPVPIPTNNPNMKRPFNIYDSIFAYGFGHARHPSTHPAVIGVHQEIEKGTFIITGKSPRTPNRTLPEESTDTFQQILSKEKKRSHPKLP